MTSFGDLLLAPPDAVTVDVLNQLVVNRTPEGFNLEYKRELGNGNKALSGIAALANTFGGVLLVGIDEEDRPGGQGFGSPGPAGVVGVEPRDRTRLASMCSSQFAPPFDPPIQAVELGNGRVVLVVRVFPELAPRPLMYDLKVLVRTEAGNRPADLFRLRELFLEERVAGAPALNATNATPFSHPAFLDESPADVVIRALGGMRIVPSLSRPRLTDDIRHDAAQLLLECPIEQWLRRMYQAVGGRETPGWLAEGVSTSRHAEFHWRGQLGSAGVYPECQVGLELSASPGTSVGLNLRIDVVLRTAVAGLAFFPDDRQNLRWRLGIDELYHLFEDLLATFAVLVPAIGDRLGSATGRLSGPYVGLLTRNAAPITDILETQELRVVPGNSPGQGGNVVPDPELDLRDAEGRRRQAADWLSELLLDLGFAGVENAVRRVLT